MRRVKSKEKTFFHPGGVENTGEKTRASCLPAEHSLGKVALWLFQRMREVLWIHRCLAECFDSVRNTRVGTGLAYCRELPDILRKALSPLTEDATDKGGACINPNTVAWVLSTLGAQVAQVLVTRRPGRSGGGLAGSCGCLYCFFCLLLSIERRASQAWGVVDQFLFLLLEWLEFLLWPHFITVPAPPVSARLLC